MILGRRRREIENAVSALQGDVRTLRDELLERSAATADAMRRIQEIEGRFGEIELRVTNVVAELGNQLHELHADIERLENISDSTSAESVAQLREQQVRIATEQARYAISFRHDLAEVVELLRRTRG
jgi:phage shock protein A